MWNKLIELSQERKPPEPKVLCVGGSPRKNGNTDFVLERFASGLAAVEIPHHRINLGEVAMQGCIGCERCRRDKICTGLRDGMTTLYPEILSSRGLVVATPVHNYNVSAWMKAFIDRFYCFYNFENTHPRAWSSNLAGQHRKVVVLAVCEQKNLFDMGFALDAMQRPFEALGYELVEALPVFQAFEKGAVKKQEETLEEVFSLGKRLGESLKKPSC